MKIELFGEGSVTCPVCGETLMARESFVTNQYADGKMDCTGCGFSLKWRMPKPETEYQMEGYGALHDGYVVATPIPLFRHDDS